MFYSCTLCCWDVALADAGVEGVTAVVVAVVVGVACAVVRRPVCCSAIAISFSFDRLTRSRTWGRGCLGRYPRVPGMQKLILQRKINFLFVAFSIFLSEAF